MFHFSIGFSVRYGQSSSEMCESDKFKEMMERMELMEIKNEERYQEFQMSKKKQNSQIAQLKQDVGDTKHERDHYKTEYDQLSQKYSEMSQKYLQVMKENHRLKWEKEAMEKGIKKTFIIPRKWTQRNIRKYMESHHYRGLEEDESDSEEVQGEL